MILLKGLKCGAEQCWTLEVRIGNAANSFGAASSALEGRRVQRVDEAQRDRRHALLRAAVVLAYVQWVVRLKRHLLKLYAAYRYHLVEVLHSDSISSKGAREISIKDLDLAKGGGTSSRRGG